MFNEVNRLGVDALIIEGTTLSSVEELREAIVGNPIIPEGMTTEGTILEKMSERFQTVCRWVPSIQHLKI